ncbi:MAG: NYN domain-containing protein [Ruminococcaceae bacterium]|nr:NYN domain-containing protein [Oscillospiraceae bacterium]
MKKIAVFLDGANLFYTQKKLGWNIDSERLLEYCKELGEVVEATYYIGKAQEGNSKKFLDKLSYIGYSLETKPIKNIYDQEGNLSCRKANLDIEIVLDMFNMIDRYDLAILISGDGDFERPLQILKSRGKEVKVISTKGIVASELIHVTGLHYIDFLSIKELVKRKEEHIENAA